MADTFITKGTQFTLQVNSEASPLLVIGYVYPSKLKWLPPRPS